MMANQLTMLFLLRSTCLFFFLALFITDVSAQQKQTVRGVVTDILLKSPVAGATVALGGRQAITDENGEFKFSDVAVGNYSIRFSSVGYQEVIIENIIVNAGKESVLNIELDKLIRQEEAVIVKAKSKKNNPLNEMSVVSSRAFTVEETQKYAAAVNDPLRMATSFAGIMTAEDGGNNIVIRGNNPSGLLWRMEGLDIPNPNHFSSVGTTGGGISILSAQLLGNSDFITGAFASEYGNGLSGVFDLKLRKGNNEKREYTLKAGILGLNAAAEGPFSKKYKGSYLINYRYSTLSLLQKIGLPLAQGVTDFQDLSYHIHLPAGRAGTFGLFGFNGRSSQEEDPLADPQEWKEEGDRYGGVFVANTSMNGLTHTLQTGNRTMLRSAAGYSRAVNRYDQLYVKGDGSQVDNYKNNYQTGKWMLTSVLNHRFSNKSSIRGGIILSDIGLDYSQYSNDMAGGPLRQTISADSNMQTLQAFVQWKYALAPNVFIHPGVHYLHLFYNNTSSAEPRLSLRWSMDEKRSVSIGYGLHSQLHPYSVYFYKANNVSGETVFPNKDLKLAQAHHFVASYQQFLRPNLRLKAEVYYQHLFRVPVADADTSTFSLVNVLDEWVGEKLVSKGKGKNYGVELSLERYLANDFYYMLNTSLYRSLYTDKKGVERSTRFDGGFLNSLTAGKDFVRKAGRRTTGLHLKAIWAGGYRTTPVDIERSERDGYTVYQYEKAYSIQNPAYFRLDLRFYIKWNVRRITHHLSLDMQNVTNRLNAFGNYYDAWLQQEKLSVQNGIIPILNYKIEF